MKTYWKLVLAAGFVFMAFATPVFGTEGRPGVIIDLQPIKNQGDDETAGVKKKRVWGAMAGRVASIGLIMGANTKNEHVNTATTVVAGSGAVQKGSEELAARIGGPGPTTRFVVKVRLDKRGKVLTITQLRTDLGALKVGDRVFVEGTGDNAKVFAENPGSVATPATTKR